MTNSKSSIDYKRIIAWLIVAIAIIATAQIVGKNEDNKKEAERKSKDFYVMRAKINLFWSLQEARVDKINKAVNDYVKYYNLQPGSPLPPNTFYDTNDPIWECLQKDKRMDIVDQQTITGKYYKTIAQSLTVITDKVPNTEAGEEYAYAGVLWPISIMGSVGTTYPPTPEAMRQLQIGIKEIEKKSPQDNNSENLSSPSNNKTETEDNNITTPNTRTPEQNNSPPEQNTSNTQTNNPKPTTEKEPISNNYNNPTPKPENKSKDNDIITIKD